MAGEEAPAIKGLQLWLPSDSFKQDYNIARISELMADFQTLSILHKPGETPIYCSGNSGVIYHAVEDEAVQRRLKELRFQPSEVTSCLQPNQLVDMPALPEEARVRELHLGLGRTAMFLAANAERDTDFMQAVHDLKEVFLMLNQPIHQLDRLTKTSAHQSGLIYMLVKAARKHKTLSREAATDVADALDTGILPVPSFKIGTGKGYEPWGKFMGKGFIERTSFVQKKPEHLKGKKPRAISKPPSVKKTYKLHREKTPAEKRPAPKRSKTETFIYRLTGDKRQIPYSAKLVSAHDRFLGENPQPFAIRNNTKLETAKLGVEAYLESMMVRGNDTAGQILAYLTRKKGGYKFGLVPLIVIGNLLTAKVNANGGIDGEQVELPGLNPRGVSDGFKAVRYALNMSSTIKEDRYNEKLGDIIEAYLGAAFTEADIQEEEVPLAPEGVIPVGDFVLTHRIGQAALETILAENGIDIYNYKFGHHVRRGLTTDDQEFVETVIEETVPPLAPKGTVSISGFCIVRGLAKPHVDQLIKEHGVETGVHLFNTQKGRSLSPEAQQKLDELLYE